MSKVQIQIQAQVQSIRVQVQRTHSAQFTTYNVYGQNVKMSMRKIIMKGQKLSQQVIDARVNAAPAVAATFVQHLARAARGVD